MHMLQHLTQEEETIRVSVNPKNSHLQFDGVVPIHAFPQIAHRAYGSSDDYMTYIKVFNEFEPETLSKKITDLTHNRAPFLKDIPIKHFIQHPWKGLICIELIASFY